MKKEINLNHFLFLSFVSFLLFPENSGSIIPSLPIDNLLEVFTLFVVIFLTFKAINKNNKFYILIFLFLIIKIALILQPTNLWKLCYQDDISPRAPEKLFKPEIINFLVKNITNTILWDIVLYLKS